MRRSPKLGLLFVSLLALALSACKGATGASCTVKANADGSRTLTCPDGSSANFGNGQSEGSCTVADHHDGTATLSCPDGTSVLVTSGAPGAPGAAGAPGSAGAPGASCTLSAKVNGQATLTCPDGTTVLVSDGSPGAPGTPGAGCTLLTNDDGTHTLSCPDGTGFTFSTPIASELPQQLKVVSGEGTGVPVTARSAKPLVVQVIGASGGPVAGVTIFFTVTSGDATSTVEHMVSDTNGIAYAYLQAGTHAGPVTLEARIYGMASPDSVATIDAEVQPGVPFALTAVSGNGQRGEVAQLLAAPIVLSLKDRYANPIVGAALTCTAGSGASFSPAPAITDASGTASTQWQLGTVSGAQTATCSTTTGLNISLTALGTPAALASLTAQAPSSAAVVGTAVSPVPTFLAADRFGNPIGGVPISLEVTSGSASLQSTSLTTSPFGTIAVVVTPSAAGVVHLVGTTSSFSASVDLHAFDPVSLGVPQSHFDSVTLSWSASTDPSFVAYRLYRSTTPGVTQTSTLVATVSDAATTSVDDTPPVQGQLYYYRLFVDFQGGFTIASEERSARAGLLLDLGAPGFQVKLTSDRSTAYVSVPTNNEVLEVATDTLQVKRHLSVGSRPMGISLSPDESTLYAALNGAGSVAIVTLATGDIRTVAMTTQLGDARTYDVLALRDGTVLVTSDPESNGFAWVVRFDPATTATPWRVANGNIIRARPTLLQSPTANFVYVGEGFSPNQLDKLDTSNTNAPIVATPSWGSVSGTGAMTFYPDGSKIILSSGQLFDPNTMAQVGLIGAGYPLVNASGTLCYVAAGNSYYWGGTANPAANTVEIWDLQSQLKVSSFALPNPADKIAFLVDDARILALGAQNLFEVKVP